MWVFGTTRVTWSQICAASDCCPLAASESAESIRRMRGQFLPAALRTFA